MNLAVRRASPSDHAALLGFFEAAGSRCYCHYHDFRGDGRAWQASLVENSEGHAAALLEGLASGAITALLALDGERVVGWMRFGPPGQNRQYGQRVYRDLPCLSGPRERVASAYCFLVDPTLRRRGVARALLGELVLAAGRFGFETIEGLPRGPGGALDEEFWTGPLSLFEELGFAVVHDFAPYPVVRRGPQTDRSP